MTRNFLLNDRQRLFWALQLGGWAAWGIVGKYLYTRTVLDEIAPNYGLYVAVITVIGLVISLGLRYLYRFLWRRPVWIQAVGFLGGSSLAGYAWMSARSKIFYGWIEKHKDVDAWLEKVGDAAELYERVSFLEGFGSGWTVMLVWSALYFAIKYYRIFQEVRESALRSSAMAHEAQLKMLRYQLNPHFLFNTLNAISTLILEQQIEPANRMVSKLSNFLRYSLDNDPMQKISLEQEITALKLYLDIEKVRFEERLQLEIDIEDDARHALIPSLLLQPMIENAIKYGIAKSDEGGHLRIAARVFAGELLIELSDDGPGVELVDGRIPDSKGVGLSNTRERLRELYGSQHSFKLKNTDPHGLTVNIRIPFETRKDSR
ncbi:MAG: histidine kinase [Gammaproteobacteria bacterium]|nr:MAG: histidine kinase [Gammaproteobacteria bacterium]